MSYDACEGNWESRYRFEVLSDEHKPLRAKFSCGEDALDEYLQRRARQDKERGLSVTHVLIHEEQERIAGYYTLSSEVVERGELPGELEKGLGKNLVFPAILLGRLAVDLEFQRGDLGRELLLDALYRALDLSRKSLGTMAILVDPLNNKAQEFYVRHGFEPLGILEAESSEQASSSNPKRRLYLPMGSIARL